MIKPPPICKEDLYIIVVPHEYMQNKASHHPMRVNISPLKRN